MDTGKSFNFSEPQVFLEHDGDQNLAELLPKLNEVRRVTSEVSKGELLWFSAHPEHWSVLPIVCPVYTHFNFY